MALIHLLFLLSPFLLAVPVSSVNLPVLTLTRDVQWQFVANSSSSDQNSETVILPPANSEYIVPAGTQIIRLFCWANYPVVWALNEFRFNSLSVWNIRANTARTVTDFYDYSTYNYTATLEVIGSGQTTQSGRYICRGTRNHSLSSSVYLYWDETWGLSKVNLVLAKETIELEVTDPLILPCYLSKPTAPRPVLYKEDHEIRSNSSLIFDPKVGFTIRGFPYPLGEYRCVIHESEDYVRVIVKNSTKTSLPSLSYVRDKREIHCCTGDDTKAPDLRFFPCENPVACEVYRIHGAIIFGYTYYAANTRVSRQSGCSIYKLRYLSQGIALCNGNNFNISMPVIFPSTAIISDLPRQFAPTNQHVNLTYPPAWSQWSQIEPEEMVAIVRMENLSSGRFFQPSATPIVYYSGQNITVQCVISGYYFSGGLKWALNFRNGTVKMVNTTQGLAVDEFYDLARSMNERVGELTVKADESLVSILCLAPVWNSSLWVHKAFFPYVNRSTLPDIVVETSPTVQWYVNDTHQQLVCQASGSPLPTVIWFKDNETLLPGHNIELSQEVKSDPNVVKSVLIVHRVSYHSSGVYACLATNVAGNVEGFITVNLIELSSWPSGVVVTFGVVGILVLLAAVGVVLWKIGGKRNEWLGFLRDRSPHEPHGRLEDQTNAATNTERPTRRANPTADSYNQSFDPVALNADLLNCFSNEKLQ